jgi:hypothetical protein
MRIYTVHEPPFWIVDNEALPGENAVFIREGFNWFALLLPLVWALWHRLWLVALGLLAAVAALSVIVELAGLGEWLEGLLGAAFAMIIGFEANDLRRLTLARRSWSPRGVVAGRGLGEAERRYFAQPRAGLAAAP